MAELDKTALINKIDDFIKANGVGAVTGDILNEILKDVVFSAFNKIDDSSAVENNIGTAVEFGEYMENNIESI